MMRLKKGDKVEVMNVKEVPVSWRVAEILSGNGHTYRVQYESYPGMATEQGVETVSRMLLRPCWSVVQGVENYVSGDIVEVFYEYAWKTAAVLRVLESKRDNRSKKISLESAAVPKQYLVRLLGCLKELIIDESSIRRKQTWHDDKWMPFEKGSQKVEDLTACKPSTSNCYQKINFRIARFNVRAKKQPQKDCKDILDETSCNYSRSLKRMSPYDSSTNEAHNGHTQKLRAIEKDTRNRRLIAAPVLEKVDAVAYPKEMLGEKNMHASFKIISTKCNQMERERFNHIRNYQLNSSDSDACSVGSCSVSDQSPNLFGIPYIPLLCQDRDTIRSDAESYYSSDFDRKSSSCLPEEEAEVSIRRLEMYAYRRTLEALYASGPLSWEQESMLTNLRIMLHISNDEHLMELKSLISAKTARNVR